MDVTHKGTGYIIAEDVTREVAAGEVMNVEAHGNAIRLELPGSGRAGTSVTFWTVDAREATAIAGALPDTKTSVESASDEAKGKSVPAGGELGKSSSMMVYTPSSAGVTQ